MKKFTKSSLTLAMTGAMYVAVSMLSGCATLNAVPASRLPPELLGRTRNTMQQISISRLRQDEPAVYQISSGDVLGIYIENVLGVEGEAPPVHFPESGDQPPALGFPVPVREDGTLALPLIQPINVDGLTLPQTQEAIQVAYASADIRADSIIVTLMRRRMYRVTVIREEEGGKENVTKRGTGKTIDLPAYENDLLHALNETGGMPGLDAKNEIYILRGDFADGEERDRMIAAIQGCREPCTCPPEIPEHPSVIVIPIRYYPEKPPTFTQDDIILKTGDVIYIASRDREKFYTGGTMTGGEHLLPRDYDLDVLGAIAIGGGKAASGGTGIGGINGGGGAGGGTGIGPSELIVIRKLPCGGQIAIKIDLNKALADGGERILVQPEDTLILRYTIAEEIANAALRTISFNFLFSGLSGGGI